jgi:phosphopentomutase
VPVLAYGRRLGPGVDLGTRETFSDLGQTIADVFGAPPLKNGRSFLSRIRAGA